MKKALAQESLWHLEKDLFWARFDLYTGVALRRHKLPQLHLNLSGRYRRIADYFESRGWMRRAAYCRAESDKHLRLSGWKDTPPPGAALAMPVPDDPTFTEANGSGQAKTS